MAAHSRRGIIVRWLKRLGLGLVGLVILALCFGASWEAWSRYRFTADFPARGRMVDIGGRRLHLDCRGTGTPVVVLESGLDATGSLAWSAVHDKIAATTRTCAYDRAGIAWSDDKPGVHDAEGVAADLHKLLQAAGEPGPYVLVAHSLGGPFVMVFARRYPADVAGAVFVDTSHPDQIKRSVTPQHLADAADRTFRIGAALAWTGLPRLILPGESHPGLDPNIDAAMLAVVPGSIAASANEFHAIETTFAQSGQLRSLGDRPLYVLTAGKVQTPQQVRASGMTQAELAHMHTSWAELQADEASWSTRSHHDTIADASHYIQFDRPDVVIAAVNTIVAEVRADPAK